jgi:alkanesulfonate monooxygenase SsuD/methylene tetrahydromethanopterin reductase-like flavin-dependent oxidoreductase (luciferase family)
VGVGAIENEMEAMGTPYKERGAFTDEAIDVMRVLWKDEDPRFTGKYSRFAGMKFSPKPTQKPIPIVIGGISPAAIRRAARAGDGWQPLGFSPDALAEGIATLRAEARACGRDAAKIPVAISMTLGAPARNRFALGTTSGEVLKNARAFAGAGADALLVSIVTTDPREARTAMEMVAREVMPAVAG